MGNTGEVNVQGEEVQKLDVIANRTLVRCLGYRGNIGLLVSEEDEEPHVIADSGDKGRYIVLFDPLDGSSNINANVNIGTIFSIMERPVNRRDGQRRESDGFAAGIETGGGGLCALRKQHGAGLHGGIRRAHVHAGPVHRGVRAGAGKCADAGDRARLTA